MNKHHKTKKDIGVTEEAWKILILRALKEYSQAH